MSLTADSIPTQGIDFGYCGVKQQSTRSFTLFNPSQNMVRFETQQDNCPFEITPSKGLLAPKQKQEVTIVFAPQEAKVLVSTVIFKFSEGEEGMKVLKLSAIGKYPFLTINQEKLDFETLLVGKVAEKQIMLKNQSQVPAQFTVEKVSDDGKELAFSIDNYSGTIPPNTSFQITVKYVPQVVGQISCTQYRVKTEGGNDLTFDCQGEAMGFKVHLSVSSIHFGEVSIGNNTNRLLNIINDSELPTTFQFFSDNKNVFSFSKLEGTLNAKSSTRIIVTFTPQQTANYYERIFCIVKNHELLYVDLIGTCYDILTKPIPLLQRHVDIFRHKVIMGMHNKPLKDPYEEQDKLGNSTERISDEEGQQVNLQIPIDKPNQVVLHKEMLLEMSSENRDLKLREEFLDFNFTQSKRLSEQKHVTIDNKYPFEAISNWVLLKVRSKVTGDLIDNPFRISPAQARIPANGSFTFTVEFAPTEPDSYFFQQAQCYLYLQNGNQNKVKKVTMGATMMSKAGHKITGGKTLLSSMKKTKYEDAMNEELDPPSCLNLKLVGHSFPPGSQPFIPMVKVSPSNKVTFTSTCPHEAVYSTVQIVNTSDTPVYYKMLQDPSKTFRSYPSVGMIDGKSFGLICFEFQPKSPRVYNFTTQVLFNHSSSNIQNIHLTGYCYNPSLILGNGGKLFYPPTFIGVSTKQKIAVKNNSRIPIETEWKVPEKYKTEIQFDPPRSLLLPNEEVKITTTFTPLKKKEYIIDVPIYAQTLFNQLSHLVGFYNPGSGLNSQQLMKTEKKTVRYDVEIVGAGSDGVITISPKDVDFGTITVGFAKTMSVQVLNKSNTNLYVELRMAQKVDDNTMERKPELPQMQKILDECFKFDHPKGIINAKSKKKVNITFKPTLRFDFDIHLICIAREKPAKEVAEKKAKSQEPEIIVEKSFISVHAMGDFPLLRFTDVRNDGISTANLWERFRLTTLNKELLNPLNVSEIEFNNSDKTNQSIHDLQKNLKIFTWDFGKVPQKHGPKPRVITLTLKNIGGVRANFQFKMPNDQEIELEPWADPGEPSEEQAFERHILESKIFHIEPRKGALEPGQQLDLKVFYHPIEVKLHYLKIFFAIQNGKPLIINLQGQTLHRRAQLQLLKDTYYIPPVPIGLKGPVAYPIEIKNLGITKLKYTIDDEALRTLNYNNYDFSVFEIENKEGTVPALETSYIFTLFRPLEAKSYDIDLPIKISDIEGPNPEQYLLKLRGTGYNLEDKKPEEEHQFYEDLPKCRANLNEEGSKVAFSVEEIDFGEVEKFQPSRRFVILYNLHQTQKLKFEFSKAMLTCLDDLKLEPSSGELKPNSHQNIKMTLVGGKLPINFEGEIQCQIEWETEDFQKQDVKSGPTTVGIQDNLEYLFLRLKKRNKFTKADVQLEQREGETLVENVLYETVHDILESEEFDKLFDDCHEKPVSLFHPFVNNQNAPSCDDLTSVFKPSQIKYVNQNSEEYEKELKELTGFSDQEIFRKRMFLQKNFTDLMEFMLEDTIFNLMEEATYEEFDLTQAPRIYIRKEDVKPQNKQD